MIEIAIEAALEAGKLIKKFAGNVKDIEIKQGLSTNIVTEIDKESEKLIINHLRKNFPTHDFLAEESGSHRVNSEYKWIIDPIDGTTNFMHGLPIYCVSIALERNGEVVLGVVYDPNQNELFTAERGKGAFMNDERLKVSKTEKLIDSLVVTGFPYDIKDNPFHAKEHFINFLTATQAVRRLGSAALDLAYVAAGRFDGFWEVKLNPWDMAAAVLLVEEAGGKFSDFLGNPSNIYNPNVLATNGKIHNEMVAILKKEIVKTDK